ncbi:hypothetical protein F5Y17DRAFT_236279 [Xylariaceae sp. FL0594]|nr:hypothetical protein F5Y17DRAFT_236279 [Xylariaceae sp. FL0594]
MTALVPPEYRSVAEYQFSEEQADAIVRITTYHDHDYCRAVIWFPPREHVDIRLSIATPFPRTSDSGLGSLDRLPPELLYDIILRLDMHSLFKFRQANLCSRQMTDFLHEYRAVISHGLNLFCALLRTQLAIGVSLSDFYGALCTNACAFCGGFGGFISLLTWNRCCFKCLQEAPETQVRTLALVRKHLHLTKSGINQLRSFKTLPGRYTLEESVYKSRIKVVSLHQAIMVSGQQPDAAAQAKLANSGRNGKFNLMGSCALPHYDRRTGRVEPGMWCAGCQLALETETDRSSKFDLVLDARDKVYAHDEFLRHFRLCEQAQLLWRSSDEGNNRPPELPEFARIRGYFRNTRPRVEIESCGCVCRFCKLDCCRCNVR